MVVGLGIMALVLLGGVRAVRAQEASPAEVETQWNWTLGSNTESTSGGYVVVKQAEACRLPDGLVGPDDVGNGIRIELGGVLLYETGAEIIIDEYEGTTSVTTLSYYEPSSFTARFVLPGYPSSGDAFSASTRRLVIECRDAGGSWTTVVDRDEAIPPIEQAVRFEVVQDFRDPSRLLIAWNSGFLSNEPAEPDTSEIVLTVDGEPVPLTAEPDLGLIWTGPLPATVEATGLHEAIISFRGQTTNFLVPFGFDPTPDPVIAATTSSTTPTATPATSAPSTTTTPTTGATTAPPATEPPVRDPAGPRSQLGETLPTLAEIDWSPATVASALLLSVFALLIIGFQADLVNKTIEENRDRFILPPLAGQALHHLRSAARRVRALAVVRSAARVVLPVRHSLAFAGVATLMALTALMADAETSLTSIDLADLLGTTAAIVVVGIIFAWLVEDVERRLSGGRAEFALIMWTVVPAVVLVAVSRLAGFHPPYVYGLVAGYLSAGDTATRRDAASTRDQGLPVLLGASVLLVASLAGFVGHAGYGPGDGAPFGPRLLDSFLAGLFIVGILSLLFGLIPLRFMDGATIWAWSRFRWAAIYAPVVAAFLFLMVFNQVEPPTGPQDEEPVSALTEAAILFVAFCACSLAFWAWFGWRRPRRTDATPPATTTIDLRSSPVATTDPTELAAPEPAQPT